MMFFDLGYGKYNSWIATLGPIAEQVFDAQTGKEDFTEQRRVASYLENWRPTQQWIPQPICLHFKERGRQRNKADRIYHNAVGPFISQNAVDQLRPLLEREGYVLPLDVKNSDEKFYLWRVSWIENSVDLARSEKFPNGKTVKKFVFDQQRIEGLTAFRPHYTGMYNPDAQGQVLVSEEFKDAWLNAGLTGIDFKSI